MARRVGAALRDALSGKRAGRPMADGKVRGTLLSPWRLRVFSAVTHHPCMGSGEISSISGMAPHSVRWHLRMLEEQGLVAPLPGTRGRYAATGQLRDEDRLRLEPMAGQGARRLFLAVAGSPGMTTGDAAEAAKATRQAAASKLKGMARAGLLYSVRDGKVLRHFQSEGMLRAAEDYSAHGRKYLDFFVHKVAESGISARASQVTAAWAQLELSAGRRKTTVRLGINPYITILKDNNYM
ncbi:MAG: hypothetical protein HZB92_00440 [Euryarchaeota archaeon]|nr:hypothetical protein [Euryarchaeota archaeon]